jgi:TP901 family phage tail tape measure protein
MNLDAVLRIAARVTGTEAVQQLNRALGTAGRTADDAKKSFKNVVDSSAWQGAAVVATGIGVALGLSARAAIEFESAVADVRKVVSGLDTPAGLTAIRQEILQLSREMPITAQGFAEIYAAAGQSGIAREEIRAFAVDVTKMAVAFDMTAADAGNAMAKLRTALGLSQPEVLDLADALNFLSNNTASTGAELVNFTQRAGVMGQQAGLTAEQTAAFGAAMVGAGAEVEVAATSFNNMIRALSRGASMTARQESALQRLGLASRTVADGERDLTAAVQRGSDRRLEIIQDESDRQQAELRKRYRRQLQLLEDQWEDESDGLADALRDQTDDQIKALQRQAEQRIKALQQQAGDNQAAADQQADLIRDQLEDQIELIREATDRELKLQQRAERDKRQEVRDSLDERLADEQRGLERINKERVEAEREGTRKAMEAAKAAAGDGGSAAGRALSKRLQEDALGTIRDVFQRIKGLAEDEQISVISDLFGDEARALAPIINNLAGLEKALGLVGDKTQYAGSMTREYEVRSQTAANALQLLQNSFNALAIEVGSVVVPELVRFVQVLAPLITNVSKFAAVNPAVTGLAVAVSALGAAFVLAAPFIVATISLLGSIGAGLAGAGAAATGFAATIAGWSAVLLPAITALQTLAATVAAVVGGIVTAPVAVTVAIAAAVVAVIAGVVVFRKEIGGFFTWLLNAAITGWSFILSPLQPVLDAVVGAWRTLLGAVGAVYSGLATLFWQTYIEPIQVAFQGFQRLFIEGWNTVAGIVTPIVQGLVQGITSALQTLAQAYMDNMITPIIEGATSVWEALVQGWNTLSDTVSSIFRAITSTFQRFVVQPLTQAWGTIVDTAQNAIRGLLGWAANAINGVIRMINRLISAVNQVRAAAGLSAFGTIGQVQIPAFAKGGYVSSPTVGLIGEAGREYVVPEAKAAGFANNIMAGRRGAAAIPSGVSPTSGSGSVQINVTTGPIRQDADGQRWMTMEDGERMVRDAVAQLQRTNRTPAGRALMGVR